MFSTPGCLHFSGVSGLRYTEFLGRADSRADAPSLSCTLSCANCAPVPRENISGPVPQQPRSPFLPAVLPYRLTNACCHLARKPASMPERTRSNAFSLRLPRTTRAQADVMAHRQGISMNEFILRAVAEKIANLTRDSADLFHHKLPHLPKSSASARNRQT